MTGGTISGNRCYLSGDLSVGGVYSEGTFTMTGGAISGNGAADGYSANSYGGVYFSGTFKVSGGASVRDNVGSNVRLLENEAITVEVAAYQQPRPQWDVQLLLQAGFSEIRVDNGVWKRVYQEIDEFYNPTPIFTIAAYKR
jgi:hypothetical protein